MYTIVDVQFLNKQIWKTVNDEVFRLRTRNILS